MIEAFLVIGVIMLPILLFAGIMWYADYSASKSHKKWIEDFKKRNKI